MTVAELIKKLQNFDPTDIVYVRINGDFEKDSLLGIHTVIKDRNGEPELQVDY